MMEAAAVSGKDMSGGSSSETCPQDLASWRPPRSRDRICPAGRPPRPALWEWKEKPLAVLWQEAIAEDVAATVCETFDSTGTKGLSPYIYTENWAGRQKSRIFMTVKLTYTTVR